MVQLLQQQQQLPRKYRKLFQDSIAVTIPLDVTADLGVAIRRTREKRIKAIYEHFPELRKKEDNDGAATGVADDNNNNNNNNNAELESEDEDAAPQTSNSSNKKRNDFVPQRNQYGNMLDYLEAKYARGVMLLNEEDGDNDDNQGDGGGDNNDDDKRSVYDSESSFLDDSLLKRDVAEQVLAQTTHTKLEVQNEDDDFFVNVGALEVEDHDLMDYDPLDDEKAKGNNKKRKRPSEGGSGGGGSSGGNKGGTKKNKPTKKAGDARDNKSKKDAPKSKVAPKKKTPKSDDKSGADAVISDELKEKIEEHKKKAADLKEVADKMFQEAKDHIEKMTDKELPRKTKKNEKVSITVPEGKNPGDDITFSNPHNPGQKLRVKVPKNTSAGGKFVVSVPVASDVDPDVDNNKFNREIQEKLDDFSHAYDEWCHAEAAYRELDPKITEKFQLHHERMNKFAAIIKVFPSDLVTPIDATYLRKVVRRARQNKHKRNKTARMYAENEAASASSPVPSKTESSSSSGGAAATKGEEQQQQQQQGEKNTTMELLIPGKGVDFPEMSAE